MDFWLGRQLDSRTTGCGSTTLQHRSRNPGMGGVLLHIRFSLLPEPACWEEPWRWPREPPQGRGVPRQWLALTCFVFVSLENENDWKKPLIPPFIPGKIILTFYQKNKDKNVNKKKHLRGHTFDLAILFTGFQTVRHDSVFKPFHLVAKSSCIGNLYLISPLVKPI